MTYRLRNILLAVVLAVLAAFLTALYVASYQNRVDEGQKLIRVFVAKSDIAPGTPAARLASKVEQQEIQQRNVVPGAIFDVDTLAGQTTSQWIYSGEQLSARRFGATGSTGIRAELKGNLRALQISGSATQLLDGTLRPGDRVDVLANLKAGDGGGRANVARVILRDLEVLRAGGAGRINSKLADSGDGASTVVLLVTDAQAHKLFFVTAGNEDHEWTLQLRPPADAADSPESVSTLPSVIRDGLARNQAGGNTP